MKTLQQILKRAKLCMFWQGYYGYYVANQKVQINMIFNTMGENIRSMTECVCNFVLLAVIAYNDIWCPNIINFITVLKHLRVWYVTIFINKL